MHPAMPKISPTSGGARPPTRSRAIDNKINTRPPPRRCTKATDQIANTSAVITVSTPLNTRLGSTVSAGSPARMAKAAVSVHD